MKKTFLLLTSFLLSEALTCEEGYLPNSNKICIKPKYIQGCFRYASEHKCQLCDYNYRLEGNGLCTFSQVPAPCCLDQTISSSYCRKCNIGLKNVNGQCKYAHILGCLQKNYANQCINCASDFKLVDGSCKKGIKDCEEYEDEEESLCKHCKNGYSLVKNMCLRNVILGCKDQHQSICSDCFEPFFESQGHCQIAHCKTYNDYGCEGCQCGYYLTQERRCLKMEEGCIRYQKGRCTDCHPPFTLKGSMCLISGCKELQNGECKVCEEGYELKEGKCEMDNCLDSQGPTCRICAEGYHHNDGKCLKGTIEIVFD